MDESPVAQTYVPMGSLRGPCLLIDTERDVHLLRQSKSEPDTPEIDTDDILRIQLARGDMQLSSDESRLDECMQERRSPLLQS